MSFIARYLPNGTLDWIRQDGGDNDDSVTGIALDSGGNIYVTGNFRGTSFFGGVAISSPGDDDMFLAKFDPDGNFIWVQFSESSSHSSTHAIAVDSLDNVLVTGDFTGTVTFKGVPQSAPPGPFPDRTIIAIDHDLFIAKYDSDGNLLWLRDYGGIEVDVGQGIDTHSSGEYLYFGNLSGIA